MRPSRFILSFTVGNMNNRDYNNYVYDENETVPEKHRSFSKEITQTVGHLDLSAKFQKQRE